MELIIDGEKLPSEELLSIMEKAAKLCLKAEEVTNEQIEISVTFVDSQAIKEINGQFRNIEKVTDVLSFPQYERPEEIPEEEYTALGDVVICYEQAERQAEEFGHSLQRELIYLFVHSMFHLLGYDHMEEDEKKEMRKAEEDIMNKLEILRD